MIGMITGLDGSGFSGLPLTGALAGALAPVSGIDPATLAAIGQMGAVWVGGGTLIAWSSRCCGRNCSRSCSRFSADLFYPCNCRLARFNDTRACDLVGEWKMAPQSQPSR